MIEPHRKPALERLFESCLFNARWLMAPFYAGFVLALVALLVVFFQELIHELPQLTTMTSEDAILLTLSLIDLSLAANLVLIVTFSGYENFVSKIDTASRDDRPDWMGTVDFSGLKLKLIASIVAISAIALLRAFMQLAEGQDVNETRLFWMVALHIAFVLSGVLLALMDWLTSRANRH